jgi:uncharacterized membrane protein YbhN (UPF0104 family)
VVPDHRGRGSRVVHRLLRPRIFISTVISIAIIGGLLAFADLGKLASVLTGLRPIYLVGALVFILGYTAVQSVQWLYLLDHLGIVAPRRDALFAFAGGNLTKYLPGGSYFQNYLLYETTGVDPALSSVATTLIVLLEPAVALVFLLVIGIDGWVWLRWLLGIGLPLALLFTAGLYAFIESPVLPPWVTGRRLYAALTDEVIRFRNGLERIARPRILATTTGLTAALVLLEGLALYMVARSLRIEGLSVAAALAAYYFSIGVALIIPIFTNLGTLEAGGVAALITLGVNREGAVAVMVLDRALIIALAFVLAVVFGLAFRDLVRRAVRAA